MDMLKGLNWVDIFIAVLVVRIVYVGIRTGFVTEFMKLLGLFVALFTAFHFYTKVGAALGHFTRLPVFIVEVTAFIVIWLVIAVAFKFIRDGIFMVFTVQTISAVDRWGAAVLAAGRAYLSVSMVLFIFLISDSGYLERMTFSSVVQTYVLRAAPDMYRKMTNDLVGKFVPGVRADVAVVEEILETGK